MEAMIVVLIIVLIFWFDHLNTLAKEVRLQISIIRRKILIRKGKKYS